MEDVGRTFEVVGVAIIVIGGGFGLIYSALQQKSGHSWFDDARTHFGRPLILGLEVLVAADIIETVTVDRTLESVAALGLLVLVRVILSFSLDIEIAGYFPWRRAQMERTLEAHEGVGRRGSPAQQ